MFLCAAVAAVAVAADYPKSVMKAQYRYHYITTSMKGEDVARTSDFILQIGNGESRFYDIKTQFIDSLRAQPGGEDMYRGMVLSAMEKGGAVKRGANGAITSINLDKGKLDIPTKGQLFQVYKHADKGEMTVYDMIFTEEFTYTVPMDEIQWEMGDSIKTVMGYECQQAVADYHGRRWTAWFAPEIPVQEGPWQLYGLPGLIMEAETDGGEYRFEISGLVNAVENIEPIPGNHDFIKTERKKHLRAKKQHMLNPMKALAATTGVAMPGLDSKELKHDLIETDYNEDDK